MNTSVLILFGDAMRSAITKYLVVVLVLILAAPLALEGQANVHGQWKTLTTQTPINPVHVALMHTGKVLIVSGSGNVSGNTKFEAAVWDLLPHSGMNH